MEFRKELAERLKWRLETQIKRNKDGADLSPRIAHEVSLLEDLIITYDSMRKSQNANKSTDPALSLSDVIGRSEQFICPVCKKPKVEFFEGKCEECILDEFE